MNKIKQFAHLLFLWMVLVLAGVNACQANPILEATPLITNTYAFQPLPATWTPTHTQVTSSTTPSQTSAPSLTYTPSKTMFPSLTLLPTLVSAEAKLKLDFMIHKNGGCKLPCWWGIVPGETRLSETINQLYVFLPNGQESINERTYTRKDNSGNEFTVTLSSVDLDSRVEAFAGFEMRSVDDIIQLIYADESVSGLYSLPALMSTYGKPAEVYIETLGFSPTADPGPFNILLFYPEKGILAFYTGDAILKESDSRFCQNRITPSLALWNTHDNHFVFSEQSIRDGYSEYEDRLGLQPIGQVSNLTVDLFYQAFKDPASKVCIITPNDIWTKNMPSHLYNTATPTLVDPFIETAIPTP
jgi:hypothetical protein